MLGSFVASTPWLLLVSMSAAAQAPVADSDVVIASAQTVVRAGSQPSIQGSSDYFTGSVRVDPLSSAHAPARTTVAYVTFEPGARSAWHTHPLGQTLVVMAGAGRTQAWGGPVIEIHPGDVVQCPPGVKHWHGALPDTAMTHLSVVEEIDGRNVEWMEKVSDAQYQGE